MTYEVDELIAHGSHRVRSVRVRAGGKGVNVISALRNDALRTMGAGDLVVSSGADGLLLTEGGLRWRRMR